MKPPKVCSIPDCEDVSQARGWCASHYYRWQRYGDPLGIPDYVPPQVEDPALLAMIDSYTFEHGYCPSVRDVTDHFGWHSTSTAFLRLVELRSQGYVDWVDRMPRTLRVLDAGHDLLAKT